MDTATLAVVVLGIVSVASVVAVCLCVVTLRQSAKEKRSHWERSVLVERAAALNPEPAERPKRSDRVKTYVDQQIRDDMLDAHLDPNDADDVSVYRAMRSIGMDPTSPEDVMAWNEFEPG